MGSGEPTVSRSVFGSDTTLTKSDDTPSCDQHDRLDPDESSSSVEPHRSYEGRHLWDPQAQWTKQEEVSVVSKTDLRLLVWICIMYFGLQLDRGNLANALTDNFLSDLHFTTDDYNHAVMTQRLAFLLAEFPGQIIVMRFGFRRVLPIMMMAWGTISWTQCWINSRWSFLLTRGLIGACEGGFVPGTVLCLSQFYKSDEMSKRLAFISSTVNVAKAVSALLAAGILGMRGIFNKPGWFWLFLLEGLLTFFIGLASFCYLPASLTRTTGVFWRRPWYTCREEMVAVNRLLRDDPSKGLTAQRTSTKPADLRNTWLDTSMWGLWLIAFIGYMPPGPVSQYLLLILRGLGFSTFSSNVLSIPSDFIQIFLMLALAWSSEYFGEKTLHCCLGEVFSMPLLITLLALPPQEQSWTRYSIATLISGYPSFSPILVSWISQNSFDVKRRGLSIATYGVLTQAGGVIVSQIYRHKDSPYYYTGNKILVAICGVSLLVLIGQRELLKHLNRRKDNIWTNMTEEERVTYKQRGLGEREEGNKSLEFRHIY